MFSFYIFNISILIRVLIGINYEDNLFQRIMTKIYKDPAMGRGDPRVQAMLPAPTSGHHALPLAAVQEAEAGNGILFLLVFVISIIPVPEGCFEDKRKSKMCTVFMSEQMGDMTATVCVFSP